jgi:predicted amidophosphoribosyltransferase
MVSLNCPACNALANVSDRFCEDCGVALVELQPNVLPVVNPGSP